jgi:acetyltransferase
VYLRYFQVASLSFRTAHERLTRICFADFDREMVLLALRREPGNNNAEPVVMAVGRLSKLHGAREAEVAVLVSDLYQRRGLGTELLRRLIEVARDERIPRIVANILPENHEMQTVAHRLGFQFHNLPDQNLVQATLDL